MIIIIAIAVVIMVSTLLLYLFPLIKVEGDSMLPTYSEGKILMGCRLFDKKDCKCGRVYIIHLKDDEQGNPYYIVKRLHRVELNSITGETRYFFLGDNLRVSADNRVFGYFKPSQIVAKVVERRVKSNGEKL